MISPFYPIIIVGSGPAGISTALYLQKLSPDFTDKVLMVEKARHPREKICGGALTSNATKILKDLNINLNIPKIAVNTVRFSFGNEFIYFPVKNDLFIIRRNEFDNLLVEKAIERGLKINQEEEVIDIKRDSVKINIITNKSSYFCDVLIGADGAKSSVRKILKFPLRKLSLLLLTEVPVEKEVSNEFKENLVCFDFSYLPKGLAGYTWSFPCIINNSSYLNIGVYQWNRGNSSNLNLGKILKGFLSSHGFPTHSIKIKGYVERDFALEDDISLPNVILVGEAAGVDPLLGEGISQSLQYGKFAANEIIKAFDLKDFSFKEYKRNFLRTSLGKEVKDLIYYANHLYNGNYHFWLSLIFRNKNLRNFVTSKSFKGYGNFHKHRLKFFTITLMHKLCGRKNLIGITK